MLQRETNGINCARVGTARPKESRATTLVEWRRLVPDARSEAIGEKAASLPPASPPTRPPALEIAAVGSLQGGPEHDQSPREFERIKAISPIHAVANAVYSATGTHRFSLALDEILSV